MEAREVIRITKSGKVNGTAYHVGDIILIDKHDAITFTTVTIIPADDTEYGYTFTIDSTYARGIEALGKKVQIS